VSSAGQESAEAADPSRRQVARCTRLLLTGRQQWLLKMIAAARRPVGAANRAVDGASGVLAGPVDSRPRSRPGSQPPCCPLATRRVTVGRDNAGHVCTGGHGDSGAVPASVEVDGHDRSHRREEPGRARRHRLDARCAATLSKGSKNERKRQTTTKKKKTQKKKTKGEKKQNNRNQTQKQQAKFRGTTII